MSESFSMMRMVSPDLLKARVETIKELVENDLELYEIIRDRETGEHYLHYAFLHLNIAGEGEKEIFHHLLPLETDDVVGMMYGEQAFTYPDHWMKFYLRSGPEGELVWFQPVDGSDDEEIGKQLQDKLAKFESEASFDDESMKKLFADIEKMIEKNEKP